MSDQPSRAVQDYLKAIHSLGGAEKEREVGALVSPCLPDHRRIGVDSGHCSLIGEPGEVSGELAGAAAEVHDVVPLLHRVPAQEPVVVGPMRRAAPLGVLRRVPRGGRRRVRLHGGHYGPVSPVDTRTSPAQ